MTTKADKGLIDDTPAPSQQRPRMVDARLVSIDDLCREIVRKTSAAQTVTAFALEVVDLANKIFEMAAQGEIRLYRVDSPYQFPGGLEAAHGGLRLHVDDADKLRERYGGKLPSASCNASGTDTKDPAGKTPMKKAALIAELFNEWPSIEADICEAARNGLDGARVTGRLGWYYLEDMRLWAQQRGKLKKASVARSGNSVFNTVSTVHRIKS